MANSNVILCMFVLVSSLYGISFAKKLPSFITPCKRNDPNLDDCFGIAMKSLRSRLKDGIPQLRVPPVDPLHIPKLELTTGNGTALHIQCTFKDVVVYGGSNFAKESVHADLDNGKITFKVFLPLLTITTNYHINGRLLVLPINGHGKSEGNYSEINAYHVFSGHYFMKNNKKYLKLDSKTTKIDIGKSTMYFGNLFEGNKELTDSVNNVINENSHELVEEFKPLVEDTVDSIIFQVWSNVFDYFSIDELFPTD